MENVSLGNLSAAYFHYGNQDTKNCLTYLQKSFLINTRSLHNQYTRAICEFRNGCDGRCRNRDS